VRLVVRGSCVLALLLLVAGSATSRSAEARSSTGPHAEMRSSSASVVSRPRVRYLFGTVGLEPTTLVFAAAIDTGGSPTTYYVEYGPTPAFGSRTAEQTLPAAPSPAGSTVGEVRVTATGAAPATKYHFRFVLSNAAGLNPSSTRTVTSGGSAPRVSSMFTRDARRPTELVVGATIDTGGLPTTYRVQYGRRASARLTLPAVPSPGTWASTARVVRIALKGLGPGRPFLARIVAVNAAGQAAFSDEVVAGKRRSGVATPVVQNGATPSSGVVNTVIDTGGLATTYYVEYGTRPSFGSRTAVKRLAARPGKGWNRTSKEVAIALRGLKPTATYYYRVVAKSGSRTDSSGRTFTAGGDKPSVSYVFVGPGAAASSVSFGAGIDTGGLPTTYYAEYGTGVNYGSKTAGASLPALPRPTSFRTTAQDGRTEEVSVGAGSTYHYRIVATNAAGTTYSQDHTFEPS
jgi:hypothetical protein